MKAVPRARNERTSGNRRTYDRVLIVSEGSKTEPQYFEEIRKEHKLSGTHVRILPSEGSAPKSVVAYAEKLFKEGDRRNRIAPKAFDAVYAVFDRDDHDSYFDALTKMKALDEKLKNDEKKLVRFRAVPSVPCFELWLLLHFESITAVFHRDQIYKKLAKYWNDYEKGAPGTYASTKALLDLATERADALAQANSPFDGKLPYTGVSALVSELRSFGK
jgi:hypothetical protein